MKQSSNVAVVGPADEANTLPLLDLANTYWLDYRAGMALHARGIRPVQRAQHLARIAGDASDPALRRLARQAVARFGCGEMIGERRRQTSCGGFPPNPVVSVKWAVRPATA